VVLASMAILGAIVLIRRGERVVRATVPDVVPSASAVERSEECA
jgi:hypothetical protein